MQPAADDKARFEALVRSCQDAVCAIAYAVLRDRARSEECAQDAFLIAWGQRADPRAATAAWICGIARNLARNAARRRQEVAMTMEPAGSERSARDLLIERETETRALTALATLPDRYREAVVLYYRGDESITGVAAALGCSADTARQRVHRGRTKLREALASVEATLRATRPGIAFTAACVAAWGRGARPADAATTGALTSLPWLVPSLVAGAVAVAGVVVVASGALSSRDAPAAIAAPRPRTSGELAAALTARFPAMPRATRIPPGFAALAPPSSASPSFASTTATAPGGGSPAKLVDLDFKQAQLSILVHMLSVFLDTPIWLDPTLDAPIDVQVQQRDALAVLDEKLADVGGERTEVAALRLVTTGGRTDAATLGGDRLSLHVEDAPLDSVLSAIEPKLHMPIGRLAMPTTGGTVSMDGEPYEDPSPTVTLDVVDTAAGIVLERVLQQTGLRFELTTGFVLTPVP
ncbi:MAG TPA: sigma-70 family RNA polymerase sigma factor [Kofleriaceae bacterium]|nr:sigma-70 family RNA polymerase sigma factor [Kofleriaceae bacterium]